MNPVEVFFATLLVILTAGSLANQFWKSEPQAILKELSDVERDSIMTSSQSATEDTNQNFSLFHTIEIQCNETVKRTINAKKVRLLGPLCELLEAPVQNGVSTHPDVYIEVRNLDAQTEATVFSDLKNRKFSSTYLSLQPGVNRIQVSFQDPNGKQFSQTLVLHQQNE